ncbi:MAG TPA: hypothetical protein PKI46_08090 [Bacteroidales bacterium]|nr:hypothetical protein [Bacteroidales bacterium]
MVMTEDKQQEIKLRFEAVIEYEKSIMAHQEEIKELNSSKKDTIKAIATLLEVKPSAIRKAIKEYLDSKKEKDIYNEKVEILTLLTEFNIINI